MSLIFGVLTEDFVMMLGDRRAGRIDGTILSETWDKVYRLNDDVMYAYAGGSHGVSYLLKDNDQCGTYNYAEYVGHIGKLHVAAINECTEASQSSQGYSIMIGGLYNNVPQITTFEYAFNNTKKTHCDIIHPPRIVEFGKDEHGARFTTILAILGDVTPDNCLLAFSLTLMEGVKSDEGINTGSTCTVIRRR